MFKKIFTVLLFAFFLSACQNSQTSSVPTTPTPTTNTQSYQLEVINTPTMINPNQTATPTATPTVTPTKTITSVTAIFKTSKGDVTVELFPKAAPLQLPILSA